MKTDNTIKRERASIKLISQFKMTNTEVARLFNITKQRINEGIKKSNKENFDENSLYHATDKDIELIKNMVKNSKYKYEDNTYKIRLINDYKEVAIILENKQNIEELKIFFSEDVKQEEQWKEIISLINQNRLNELNEEEKEIIDTAEIVYVTGLQYCRPNYELFHKYKKIRNLDEKSYMNFLGFERYIPRKYEYTDERIKQLIKQDISNKKMRIIDGKLYVPSKSWIRNQCTRQEEQLTGIHLSLDEFIKVYGYEQYNNRNKALDLNKLDEIIEEEIRATDMLLNKSDFTVDEKEAIAKVRIGQSNYKKLLLEKYDCKCCICNLSNKELLIGSHIKEWKDSDLKEKGDVNNGLLLCTLHDSLFDKHLISFDRNGKIMISEKLSLQDIKILNITKDITINMDSNMEYYMEYHRKKLK